MQGTVGIGAWEGCVGKKVKENRKAHQHFLVWHSYVPTELGFSVCVNGEWGEL